MLSERGEVIFTTGANFDLVNLCVNEIRSFELSVGERIVGIRYYDFIENMNYQMNL